MHRTWVSSFKMSPWGDQTWTLEGNKITSKKSKVAEQEVPALTTPQRHQPNSIWTKIPLWEFQKTVNMLQYPQPISKPRMATLKWVRTVSFYLCSPPPFPQPAQLSTSRKYPSSWVLLKRGERSRVAFWLLGGLPKGLEPVSPDSRHWQRAGILWMPSIPC